jgi:hypothetical protein
MAAISVISSSSCPVISMVRLDDGSRPLTWRELTARQPETMTAD